MIAQGTGGAPLPIVDSHIHLYAASHIPSLTWTADLPAEHVLNRQNSVSEYRTASQSRPERLGFVFLETDRQSGLQETQWRHPLDEVDFLVRIARGTPLEGEGHLPEDRKMVLGIVPWAPVPAGEKGLAIYVEQVKQHAGEKWDLIKGFRYLVQDKPAGVMLQPAFIEGLQWLGRHDLAFDLGVDARSGGLHQLEEACEMMDRLYGGGGGGGGDDNDDEKRSELRIIINHFCKPNLRLVAPEALAGHPDFAQWKGYIERMASHRSTYMKLSGMFSELPPQDESHPTDISLLVEHTKPWVDVVFQAFGPARIMFGSDWPVCNTGGPGIAKAWTHWHALVTAILTSQGVTSEQKAQIWSGTAIKAYRITVS